MFYIVECICWGMEKEISISLGDKNLKGVSEVLGNKTAMRILDELAERDLSVGDLAVRLGMNLKTVDYNVRKLLKVGLVSQVDHFWSSRGKKVMVYRAANKKIVISPVKRSRNFLLGWVGLGIVGLALKGLSFGKEPVSQDVLRSVSDFAPKAEMLAVNAGMTESALQVGGDVSFWLSLAGWEWFLFGVWLTVLVYFVYGMLKGGSVK